MNTKTALILTALLISFYTCFAQEEIPLYPNGIPNFKPATDQEEITEDGQVIRKVNQPTLTVCLPGKDIATGTTVIICPGGGYRALMAQREGSDIAKVFNDMGVAAFVLKYRLPNEEFQENKAIAPLQDAQQAIITVRENSTHWQINPAKLGVMGFSAGGHLAATAGTQFDNAVVDNPLKTSLRPGFLILIYPVISMNERIGHLGSKGFLLGDAPSQELVEQFSNELQVRANTPPAFLTHGSDDSVVPVANSMEFYQALVEHQVPTELHIYAKGEHGYLQRPAFDEWFGRVRHWMLSMDLIK